MEIVDFTSTNIILDFVSPYKHGALAVQTGSTSGYMVDWYNNYIASTLPQDFKNVLSRTPGLFSYNELFGSNPLALFSTSAGRSKGLNWWTSSVYSSGSSPSSTLNYYVSRSGSYSYESITSTSSYYYNPKFTI